MMISKMEITYYYRVLKDYNHLENRLVGCLLFLLLIFFLFILVNGGYIEFLWDLGQGDATVRSKIFVSDNVRHSVVVKRTGGDVTLEVDRMETFGKSPGITSLLNADSNLYIGMEMFLDSIDRNKFN